MGSNDLVENRKPGDFRIKGGRPIRHGRHDRTIQHGLA